jgi:hypothetical protein
MEKFELVMSDIHRQTLLELDEGYSRYLPTYPPASHLVEAGFCSWKNNDPNTWHLELTNLGQQAVSLIKCPEVDQYIRCEQVHDNVYRLMKMDQPCGFAVKQSNGRWLAFDEHSLPVSDEEYDSPNSVVIMMKLFEAEMTLSCRNAIIEDFNSTTQFRI